MTHQQKVRFKGTKTWYQLEWNNIGFKEMDKEISNCSSIEELDEVVNALYPDSNFKYTIADKAPRTIVEKSKKKKKNG